MGLAVAGFALLYALTSPRVHSIDAYYYYHDLEHGDLRALLHPHHLVYELLGKGSFELWRVLGYAGRPALPLQALSLGAVAGALLLFGRLARRACGPGILAWLLLAILGVSYLPWHYAGEGEPVAFFLLFACAYLCLLERLVAGPPLATRGALAAGLLCGLGVLFHQSLAFALPLLAWTLWKAEAPERRAGRTLALLGAAIGLVGAAYLVGGRLATGSWRPDTLYRWATGYLEEFGGRFGQRRNFRPFPIAQGAYGAFLGGSSLKGILLGGARLDPRQWLVLAPYAGVAGALGAGLIALLAGWRKLPEGQRRLAAPVALFGLIYVAAAIFWEPDNRKFWAPVLPSVLLLTAAGGRVWFGSRAGRALSIAAAAGLGVVLLGGNLAGGILQKHAQRDSQQALSLRLLELWQPGDLVVLEGNRLWQSLDYNYPRLRTTPVHRYASAAFAAADTTLLHAALAARETLGGGHRVFVSSDVLADLLRKLSAIDAAEAARLEPRPLFSFVDSENPQRPARLFALAR